jgi:hypothetical protein
MCLLSLKNFIDFIEEISYTENKVSEFGFSEGSSRVLFYFLCLYLIVTSIE